MSKPPLSDAEKLEAKRKRAIVTLCNQIKYAWSFKKITCWGDVYKFTAIPAGISPEQLAKSLTFAELKDYLAKLESSAPARVQAESVITQVHVGPPAISRTELINQFTPPQQLDLSSEVKMPQSIEAEVVEDLSSTNNYGLVPSPNERAFFYWFQAKAIVEMTRLIMSGTRAILLLSGTGTGKTYMAGGLVRRLVDAKFHDGKTLGIVNYLYVTRASIVEQTKRVFENTFNLRPKDGVEVLNIEQLRSRAGALWVNEKTRVVNGEEEFYWEWKKFMNPVVVIWDECQALKNSGSTQHKIAAALNEVADVTQVFVSATPFTRVCEAKCFAVATHKDISNVMGIPATLSNSSWPTYASELAGSQFAADDYNEAAVERLVKDLEPYIVRVKGVRPQFDANNQVRLIKFRTAEERDYYQRAWDTYLEQKAKLEAEKEAGDAEAGIQILVKFLKFRMAAEFCRKDYLAEEMYKSVTLDGKAAVCALNFKGTIIEIVKILNERYGVPRDQISLIWGGGQTQLTKKQKARASLLAQKEKMEAAGISTDEMLENLDLDEVEDRELQDLPEHLKLGMQSKEERQREIDKFQSGRSKYCIFTFRAGGVGLSLHHTDEQASDWDRTIKGFAEFKSKVDVINEHHKNKIRKENEFLPAKGQKKVEDLIRQGQVRHKDSGYAYEEDIKYVPIRPRRLFAAPTYSAIEIVQSLGRCPRLTSLSDSEQFLVFYTDTIEDDVAEIVSRKLRCLSKVVKMKEKWADIVIDGKQNKSKHIQDIPDDTGEEGSAAMDTDTED